MISRDIICGKSVSAGVGSFVIQKQPPNCYYKLQATGHTTTLSVSRIK